MNWLAEIVGVFAIVVSLVYLTLQLRQNTRSTRLETVQANSNEYHSWLDTVASNRELTYIYLRGLFDFENLDRGEQAPFAMIITRGYRIFYEQYFQWHEGAMDTAFWQSWSKQVADAIQHPGWREVWTRRKHHYPIDFQGFVDGLMETKDTKPLYGPPQPQHRVTSALCAIPPLSTHREVSVMVSLEKTYYLAQIVAVIALIVSLLYVGRQVQQNSVRVP